jgi:hypothetical protein
MFIGHPLDAVAGAHSRGRELLAQATCLRGRASKTDQVDPTPRTLTPAIRGKR